MRVARGIRHFWLLLLRLEPLRVLMTNSVDGVRTSPSVGLNLSEDFDKNCSDSDLLGMLIPSDNATVEPICSNMSCEGRCGDFGRPYYRSSPPCSCAAECMVFQDCCLDYKYYCQNSTFKSPLPPFVQRYSNCRGSSCFQCLDLALSTTKPLYMVARCPIKYDNLATIQKCEHPNNDSVLLNVPVFLNKADFLFKNVYCAICHSVDVSKAKPFEFGIICPYNETDSIDYLEKLSLSRITISEVLERRCKAEIREPEEDYPGRHCVTVDVDTCDTLSDDIKLACEGYFEPVRMYADLDDPLSPSITARNQYCAKCTNYANITKFCWRRKVKGPTVPFFGLRFSLLFDFTSESPSVGNRPSGSDKIPQLDNYISVKDMATDDRFNTFYLDLVLMIHSNESWNLGEILDTTNFTTEYCYMDTGTKDGKQELSLGNSTATIHLFARYSEGIISLSDLIEVVTRLTDGPKFGYRVLFGLLRNSPIPMTEICLSNSRDYEKDDFLNLLLLKEGHKSTNQTAAFPVEITWGGGLQGSCAELLGSLTGTRNSSESFGSYSVCGDVLERSCDPIPYHIDDLQNSTDNETAKDANKRFMYRIGDWFVACLDRNGRGDPTHGLQNYSMAEFYITVIGCSLSILGLLVTLFTYHTFVELRNLAGKCTINLVTAMLLAQLAFVLAGSAAWKHKFACQVTAVLQHIFWLATFCWTNILAFDLARTFSGSATSPQIGNGRKRFLLYMGVGWSVPLIMVMVCVALNYTDSPVNMGYGDNSICWIRNRSALLVSFIVPVSLHVSFNIVAFVFTVHSIRKVAKLASQMNVTSEKRSRLGVYARITAIMGFTWILGYLGNIWPVEALWLIFSAFNSLQGFFLFLSFVLTSKVINLYKKRYRSELPQRSSVYVKSSNTTSASNLLTTSATSL